AHGPLQARVCVRDELGEGSARTPPPLPLSRSRIDASWCDVWPVYCAVGQELPLAVPLRIDALEPDRVQPRWVRGVAVGRHEETDVAPGGDRDVTVHFHFHLIEIVDQVFLVGDAFQKRGLVVRHQRPAAVGPAIPMDEAEVRWCHAIDERHVAANNRVFDLLLEREYFSGWITCA